MTGTGRSCLETLGQAAGPSHSGHAGRGGCRRPGSARLIESRPPERVADHVEVIDRQAATSDPLQGRRRGRQDWGSTPCTSARVPRDRPRESLPVGPLLPQRHQHHVVAVGRLCPADRYSSGYWGWWPIAAPEGAKLAWRKRRHRIEVRVRIELAAIGIGPAVRIVRREDDVPRSIGIRIQHAGHRRVVHVPAQVEHRVEPAARRAEPPATSGYSPAR